jgi:Ser/Thr protein kinase RdoA (MazF antagonist)
MGLPDPPAFVFSRNTARSLHLPQGGNVNYHEQLIEDRSLANRRLAEAALSQYALAGATLSLLSDAGNLLYKVTVPSDGCTVYHPYLGRVNGHKLLLRIEMAVEHRIATTYAELALLATLLRDTDLALPEPVPAISGVLVPELETDDNPAYQCVLFRWPDLSFPEQALGRAVRCLTN